MATTVMLTLCCILPSVTVANVVQTVSQLQVSAGSDDVGSWTARIGDLEMTLELRQGNKSLKEDPGTWTVKVRHATNSSKVADDTLPAYRPKDETVTILRAPVSDVSQQVDPDNFSKLEDTSVPDEPSQTSHLGEHVYEESKAAVPELEHDAGKVFDTRESVQAQRDRILRGIEREYGASEEREVHGQVLRSHEVSDEKQEEEYNATDDEEDEPESEEEMDSEAERVMNWYPRSRVLTTKNNGYKLFPGVGWFKFVTWPRRWSDAKLQCEKDGAHLAVPDSEEESKLFVDIFRRYPDVLELTILQNQVYIGIHDPHHTRNFTTVLGTPFQPKFSLWFPGEPDNADPGEDCVTFHLEGKLRDVPCFYNLPYLCEKPIAPS